MHASYNSFHEAEGMFTEVWSSFKVNVLTLDPHEAPWNKSKGLKITVVWLKGLQTQS